MRRLWKSSCVIKRRPNPRKVSREKYLLDDLGKSLKIRFRGNTFLVELLKIRNVASTFRNGKKIPQFPITMECEQKTNLQFFLFTLKFSCQFHSHFFETFFSYRSVKCTQRYIKDRVDPEAVFKLLLFVKVEVTFCGIFWSCFIPLIIWTIFFAQLLYYLHSIFRTKMFWQKHKPNFNLTPPPFVMFRAL